MDELANMCRFCSKKIDRLINKSLFDPENSDLLNTAATILPIRISADDIYPKYLCTDCELSIKVVMELQHNCVVAAKIFDGIISQREIGSNMVVIKLEPQFDFDEDNIKQEPEEVFNSDQEEQISELDGFQKLYKCETCFKEFSRESKLVNHMEVHGKTVSEDENSSYDSEYKGYDSDEEFIPKSFSRTRNTFKKNKLKSISMDEGKQYETRLTVKKFGSSDNEDSYSTRSKKSKKVCLFSKFNDWRMMNNTSSLSETTLLTYFLFLTGEKNYKTHTLNKTFSILRNEIYKKHNIDIGKYIRLKMALKGKRSPQSRKKQIEGYLEMEEFS